MFLSAGMVMEVRGGLEIQRRRGDMRPRVSKLAGEYWWEKEKIFLGRGDGLGLESIVIIGLLYLYMNIAVQDLLYGARCEVPSVMRCQARGSTR
jgi:hypothetical protein